MKKLFKWPGGKTSELNGIRILMPQSYDRIVEPFAGSAALSFSIERPALINDLDIQVANFYWALKADWKRLHGLIEEDKSCPFMLNDNPDRKTTRTLEDAYYAARTNLRESVTGSSETPNFRAASDFYITRALAFSGMIRNSPRGGSNVPYGWYSSFKNSVSEETSNLIQLWTILNGSYESVKSHLLPNDFVFLDPPYRNRAGYQTRDWGDKDHLKFIDWMKSLNCMWMLVHTQDELYLDSLSSYKIISQSKMYSQNFKGRNNSSSKVEHIYVMNY